MQGPSEGPPGPRRNHSTATGWCPYTTGAPTPAGAAAVVTAPQPQRRRCSRCSTTSRSMTAGMSCTWRHTTPAGRAPDRSLPQPPHASGRWSMTSLGLLTGNNADPPAPACFPGRRGLRRRSARDGDTAGPSVEGGCEEFRELRLNCRSNSAIRASCAPTRAVSSSITRACDSISARSSSRDGCSNPDTTHDQHTDRLDVTQRHTPRSRSHELNGY
jgi:hypothetical protein